MVIGEAEAGDHEKEAYGGIGGADHMVDQAVDGGGDLHHKRTQRERKKRMLVNWGMGGFFMDIIYIK
jgi:hypothetical protein